MIKSPFNRPSVFTVDADSKKAVVKAVFSNDWAPILVSTDDSPTPSGKVTFTKLVAPWKALAPILVTDAGIVIDANPDEVNAKTPMLVTLDGMVTEVNADVPMNA